MMKPSPIVDPGTEPYWEGLKQNRLQLRHCRSCDRPHFYPREVCPHCYSLDLDWSTASGGGIIYSYTVAHRPAGPAYADDVPYTIAIVELDEGPRMMTWIVGDAADVTIGARVKVKFERSDNEVTLPKFELARAERL
jgi:uncharacterized OB-fold protein